MNEAKHETAEAEHQYHDYEGKRIPLLIHLMWISFWILAVWYVARYLFPNLASQLISPS